MTLYIGYTYYFDGERFRCQNLTCMSESFDDVLFYMQNVRGLILANTHNPDNAMLDEIMSRANVMNTIIAVGEIVKYGFSSSADMDSFIAYGNRDRFMMVPHAGDIDSSLAADMRKKDNKHDIMIPAIVEDIIENEDETFRGELTVTVHTLKKLCIFINRRSDLGSLRKSIMNTIEKIEAIQKNEPSISDSIAARHPILFCSEEEYRAAINKRLEWEQFCRDYRFAVNEPD